ncbi:hypothetical protein BD779DRAFT_1675629 [Infundibulicybe gibba]|nr:hypothetical protein BD779DRAFT_1675629 [Infundibulicybe gibba]
MMNLPPEIIEIIFLKLCSSKTVFPLQRDEPRLLVTQICSRWRAIALAIPSLWANIRVSLDSESRLLLDPICAWISRSAQSPLSFGMRNPTHSYGSSTKLDDLVFSVIQRCASLKLCIDEWTRVRLFTLPPGSLHALQKISISTRPVSYRSGPNEIPPATAFQQCPHLRQVKFAFWGDELDPADFNLPWHQLTHLHMPSCSLREYECLQVLQQCILLQECSIYIFPTRLDNLQRIQALSACPIVLPFLHTLHLELVRDHSVHFVRALRLPRLCNLCAISRTNWPRALLPLFQTLLSETLRRLNLSEWTPTDLPSALALVPNLETLELRNSGPEVLRTLSGSSAVPRLVYLRVGTVDSRDLFDMLEVRMAAAHAGSSMAVLSYVSAVRSGVGDIMVDTTRLAALKAAGVQVVFRNR